MTGVQGPILHRGAGADELAREVAAFIAARLRDALDGGGRATLVVSGGNTPVPVFEHLSGESLDWSRVMITLADERWVPPEHAASNERLVRTHLLKDEAACAHWEPLYNGAPTPEEGLPETEGRLAALPWPAAVVVLGMGADGHTASWFPGRALHTPHASRCMAVATPSPPNVAHPRLSLTPRAVLDARCVLVHLTGADKEPVLAQALMPGDAEALPVRRALHSSQTPCHVFYSP